MFAALDERKPTDPAYYSFQHTGDWHKGKMTQQDGASLVTIFENERPRLRGVAFRMLGSVAEAEDAVQESWLRLDRSDASEIANIQGWLTTVVSRICLDKLRQRRSRGELAFGLQPENQFDGVGEGLGPEDEALLNDAVGRALLAVLDVLSPPERLAFVLHDLFQVPYDEIAPIVEKSTSAVKMMASRARNRVRGADADGQPNPERHREIVAAFIAAARGGDLDTLIQVLDPQVVLRVNLKDREDVVVHGAEAVSSRAVLFGGQDTRSVLALVEGEPGVLTMRGGELVAAMQIAVASDRIVALRLSTDPLVFGTWETEAFDDDFDDIDEQ